GRVERGLEVEAEAAGRRRRLGRAFVAVPHLLRRQPQVPRGKRHPRVRRRLDPRADLSAPPPPEPTPAGPPHPPPPPPPVKPPPHGRRSAPAPALATAARASFE